MRVARITILIGLLAGCASGTRMQRIPPRCEQLCQHWRLHASRAAISVPGPRTNDGRTCVCVPPAAASNPHLSFVLSAEPACATRGPLMISAE